MLKTTDAAPDIQLRVPTKHCFLKSGIKNSLFFQRKTVIFPFFQNVASSGFHISQVRTVNYHSIYKKIQTGNCVIHLWPRKWKNGTFLKKLGLFCKTCSPPLLKRSPIFVTINQYDLKDVLRKTVDQTFDIFLLP